MKKAMYITLSVLVLMTFGTIVILNRSMFGKSPSGSRLERIRQSSNYKAGSFQNQHFTPVMPEDAGIFKVLKDGLFNRDKRNKPTDSLPSRKIDLKKLDPAREVLVWFGHSSYFLQIDGKKILVDPVFSGNASPFSFMVKSFNGSDVYKPEEMPGIDYLLITHDHWDHLDDETVRKLTVGKVITGLGTGAHLERWGFNSEQIIELDWDERAVLESGLMVTATPGRHFSGRGLKRNQSLWCSFVLDTPSKKIFIGGDSGYDSHFVKIGNEHGPFDLALLECGQYNVYWKYIHMMPEQTVQAAIDLQARTFMPVHWAKFALAYHAWDESIDRVTKEAGRLGIPIVHPMIGEELNLNDFGGHKQWWKGLN